MELRIYCFWVISTARWFGLLRSLRWDHTLVGQLSQQNKKAAGPRVTWPVQERAPLCLYTHRIHVWYIFYIDPMSIYLCNDLYSGIMSHCFFKVIRLLRDDSLPMKIWMPRWIVPFHEMSQVGSDPTSTYWDFMVFSFYQQETWRKYKLTKWVTK